MPNYPWYEVVPPDADLEQGDFVAACPLVVPPAHAEIGAEAEVLIREFDVIVMSQSCDLVGDRPKIETVLVCPYAELRALPRQHHLSQPVEQEAARRGNLPGYHILNRCDVTGYEFDYTYVALREVYGVNFGFLRQLATSRGDRLRLLPPYREHLSQAFARFFMRVGLPIDIPAFAG